MQDNGLPDPLSKGLKVILQGDPGYLSNIWTWKLMQRNLSLITRKRKNMAEQNSPEDERLLKKRGTIERVIEQLKHLCHSWHTRYRSILNGFANLFAGTIGYAFKLQKPSFDLNP